MALESGGLDAQIEQRMDAYRGNPQKLQQRYGANKELLDLLALQKLTSEKKAVAADMQMKMQQQPGTIAHHCASRSSSLRPHPSHLPSCVWFLSRQIGQSAPPQKAQ